MRKIFLVVLFILIADKSYSSGIIWEDYYPLEYFNNSAWNHYDLIRTSDCSYISLYSQFYPKIGSNTMEVHLTKINENGNVLWREKYNILDLDLYEQGDDTTCVRGLIIHKRYNQYKMKIFETDYQTYIIATLYKKNNTYRLTQLEIDSDSKVIKTSDFLLDSKHWLGMHIWRNRILLLADYPPLEMWSYSIDSLLNYYKFSINILDTINCEIFSRYTLIPLDQTFFLTTINSLFGPSPLDITKEKLFLNGNSDQISFFQIGGFTNTATIPDTSAIIRATGKMNGKYYLNKFYDNKFESVLMNIPEGIDLRLLNQYYNKTNYKSPYFENELLFEATKPIENKEYGLSVMKLDTNGTIQGSLEWHKDLENYTSIYTIAKSCDDTNYVVLSFLGEPYNTLYTAKINLDSIEYSDGYDKINSFRVYPNPFKEFLRIEYKLFKYGEVNVDIYNLLGEKIYSDSKVNLSPGVYSYNIDIELKANGYYMMIFKSNNGISVNKLFKLN